MDLDILNNSGIVLGLMGYFGYLLKDIPEQIKNVLIQHYSNSIQVMNEDRILYELTSKWILNVCPKLQRHVQYTFSGSTNSTIADGHYFFMLDAFTAVFIHKNQIQAQAMNYIRYELHITLVGKNRLTYLKDYSDYIYKYTPDNSQFLKLEYVIDSYSTTKYIPHKSFDDIFFNKKDELISFLNQFINNKPFYDKHGITYKTGILLYGPPGSGKSSIGRAIASYLNWDVWYINVNSVRSLPEDYGTNTVFIFEDIDCLVSSRENNELNTQDSQRKLSLHEVLNFIDGIISPSSAIFIATTNYLDKIDSALIRPGRFDITYEVPYINYELAVTMCNQFNVSTSVLDDIEFPVSPAVIQNKILFNKLTERN